MECFICGKQIDKGYICKEHAIELKTMLDNRIGTIDEPSFIHHCMICGEFSNRRIIEYKNIGYICDKEIEDSL